jgi:hypothetical protein
MLGPADTFWARFLAIIATGPDLLSAVCQHMSSIDRKSLHSVNRAMRAAMNATVTTMRCNQRTLPSNQQLHEVFPNASSLTVCIEGFRMNMNEWRTYLQQLAVNSALLLARLRHLHLTVQPAKMTEAAEIQAILEFLTRYATRSGSRSEHLIPPFLHRVCAAACRVR